MKRNSMERRRKRERQGETIIQTMNGLLILQRLQIKVKSRLMAIEGKDSGYSPTRHKKKKKSNCTPTSPEVPRHTNGGKHFKKALNKGLHDVSVHIKLKFHFFKDISLQQT